jgi:hypothetical protein
MVLEVIQSIQGYTPSDFIYKLKLTILNYDQAIFWRPKLVPKPEQTR